MKPNITITLGATSSQNCFVHRIDSISSAVGRSAWTSVSPASTLTVGTGARPATSLGRGLHLLLPVLDSRSCPSDHLGDDRPDRVADLRDPRRRPRRAAPSAIESLAAAWRTGEPLVDDALARRVGGRDRGLGRVLADRGGDHLEQQVLVELGVERDRPAVDRQAPYGLPPSKHRRRGGEGELVGELGVRLAGSGRSSGRRT